MKNLHWLLSIALGVILLAPPDAFSQPKVQQAGAISTDSLQKYCKEVFLQNCSGCHGEKGQGVFAPNLTDKYWLHGGGIKNIHNTIRDGIAGKGMISWSAVFSAQEVHQIAKCVMLFQGTSPPKARKPEGELYEDQKNRPPGTKEE